MGVADTKDGTNFLEISGMTSVDKALENGVVLVMSPWLDHEANMLWLDSTYPVNGTAIGDKRGTCSTTSGVPAEIVSKDHNFKVTFSDIRFGPIGSTTKSLVSEEVLV